MAEENTLATAGGLLVTSSRRSNSLAGPKRTESLVSRASSRLVSALAKPAEEYKFARSTFVRYFGSEVPNYGDMSIEIKNVVIKALQTNSGSAIPRWTKHKGSLRVGMGVIHLLFKKAKKALSHLLFDVGSIKEMTMKNVHSKFFTISFHNRPVVLRLQFDSYNTCCNIVNHVLHEAEFMASCFHKLMRKRLNTVWIKVLRLDKFHDDVDFDITEEVELTDEENQQLILKDSVMEEIETLLREEVDMNILGRGKPNPETCESMDRLALFLRATTKFSEAEAWFEKSGAAREDFKEINRSQALIDSSEKKKVDIKGVDKLRLELKKNLGNLDFDSRMATIEKKLEEGPKMDAQMPADEFDDLL